MIDCNRASGVPSSIPEIGEHTPIPGNVGLTEADKNARLREIFTPYHDRINTLLNAREAAGRRTVYIAMHSFTPSFKGENRAMEIGVLYNRDRRLAGILLDLLRAFKMPLSIPAATMRPARRHGRSGWHGCWPRRMQG